MTNEEAANLLASTHTYLGQRIERLQRNRRSDLKATDNWIAALKREQAAIEHAYGVLMPGRKLLATMVI